MKKTIVASLLALISTSVLAFDEWPVPQTSTYDIAKKYENLKDMPKRCYKPEIANLIQDIESGKLDWRKVGPDNTVAKEHKDWMTFTDGADGNKLLNCPNGDLKHSPVGYCTRFLQQEPYVFGISNQGGPSEHEPHFHPQAECYYVIDGETLLNQREKMRPIKTGQIIDIPGNVIHTIPNLNPEPLVILWWYPDDAHWFDFKYYWRSSAPFSEPIQEAFDKVERMRTEAGIAATDTVNYERWWKEKREAYMESLKK